MTTFIPFNIELGPLGGPIAVNYLLQAIFASIAIPLKTTVFYDIGTALGFISSAIVSTFWSNFSRTIQAISQSGLSGEVIGKALDEGVWNPLVVVGGRQVVMGGMIITWAIRWGVLMGHRMYLHGEDVRFDQVKNHRLTYTVVYTGQASWIMISSLPFWLINALPVSSQPAFGTLFDWVGIALWIVGFGLESLADHQKLVWRNARDAKRHDERFITSGLWSWSRHPNFAGEIILWGGISFLALTPLLTHAHIVGSSSSRVSWIYPLLGFAPPVFEYLALAFATGVPPLEAIAEEKWGEESLWREYKGNVPVLFGWPLSRRW